MLTAKHNFLTELLVCSGVCICAQAHPHLRAHVCQKHVHESHHLLKRAISSHIQFRGAQSYHVDVDNRQTAVRLRVRQICPDIVSYMLVIVFPIPQYLSLHDKSAEVQGLNALIT